MQKPFRPPLKVSASIDDDNPGTPPTTNVPSGIYQSEIPSDIQSTDGAQEEEFAVQPQPLINDVVTPHKSKSTVNFRPPSSSSGRPTNAYEARSPMIPPKFPSQVDLPLEANRSLWVMEIPAKVTLNQIFAQLHGGAVDRIETFPYQRTRAYGASVTFVEHSAAKLYLAYVRTPRGRLVFPGVPNNWTFNVDWNPHPLQIQRRILTMALDPRIKARRCLILRNLPIDVGDTIMLTLKLEELGGNFSKRPRVLSIFIDNEFRLARISMERICCAIQLMESKIIGRWGGQFELCTLEFDKDECERPIPGMGEVSPTITTSVPIDREYEYYQSHKDFHRMRSLYIPTLPSNTTMSDLAAQIRGGPLERITLNKKTESGMLTACVIFVHHSSARAWYEYTNGPMGGLKFPGVVWDWNVRWETSVIPIARDIWHAIMDPAVKARRGFVVKNLPTQKELSVETLKKDVLSQSNKRLSFDKFEINWKKREAKVIMSSIGSAMGGITMIKRLRRYKGCRVEFVRDECEDPIPISNIIVEKKTPANTNSTVNDVDIITQGIVQQVSYTKTIVIDHLKASITLLELSSKIRGGALDSLHIHPRAESSSAIITFLDSHTAENYFDYLAANPTSMSVSWRRSVISKPASPQSKDARRVLIVSGFSSVLTGEGIRLEIQRVVEHTAYLLNADGKNTIESITVRGKERMIATVVMNSVELAVKTMAHLPRSWSSEFGRDDCEGSLAELMP